jgi:tetratricopeptide (TPR) repeat protein
MHPKEKSLLQGLDAVPWANLEHAYGPATDVPDLLRKLLDPDPKVRSETLWTLYGNVFHQGTRYPATPYVIPFLIELCASPAVPNRGDLLRYWGDLIMGYFSVQERPLWGDGERIYHYGQIIIAGPDDPEWGDYPATLHQIYQESLNGHDLVCRLLADEDPGVRIGAAWMLACLPTKAEVSIPKLQARATVEPSGWVRAAITFALGELGAAASLHRMLAADPFPAVRCMAACELARIQPSEALLEPLLQFILEPIEGFENIPGAGGKSTGDAAFSISHLPADVQRKAIPAICDRLDQARCFDTIPLVTALLSAAFTRREEPLTELTDLQRMVLSHMVNTEELWSIANFLWTFQAYGLPHDRQQCAQLLGVRVADDEALKALRSGLAFADIGFLDKARQEILKALDLDPAVFERAPTPEECWLLCAKAFAESDPQRASTAYRRAVAINPGVASKVNPTWRLAELIQEFHLG